MKTILDLRTLPGWLVLAAGCCLVPFSSLATLVSLYSFTNGVDGATPSGGLAKDSQGNFYGTTVNGGTNQWGAIFKMTANGQLTPFYSFGYTPDGAEPACALALGTNGIFYGVTPTGTASNNGTLFDLTTTGKFTNLYTFNSGKLNASHVSTNVDGGGPNGLVLGTNGLFYGTAMNDGTNGYGTAFSVSSTGKVMRLYSFTNGTDGANPAATLAQGTNGLFYGTTANGGSNGFGTIFEMTAAGVVTGLYSFTNGMDGIHPKVGLTLGHDGNFYGVANQGGVYSEGTFFQITHAGKFTSLYSFSATSGSSPFYNNDGANPNSLITGSDGNFYGTTLNGGTNGNGSVFKISSAGALANLYSFDAAIAPTYVNSDGANPTGLLQAPDGTFYGTTKVGGMNGAGTIFHLGLAPQITTQPTNVAVNVSSNASFTIAVSGTTICQWQFNSNNIPRGTNFTLSLTNVQASNAGPYQAVVSNAFGSVTSSVATLSVLGVPVSFLTGAGAMQYGSGQFTAEIIGLTGQGNVVVDASSNLIQWVPIFTNPPAFGEIQFVDTNAGSKHQFYRATPP